jgi:hypothetical protein
MIFLISVLTKQTTDLKKVALLTSPESNADTKICQREERLGKR